MAEQPTTYKGTCHCAATRFTVTLPRPIDTKPTQVKKCNCSICSRNGYLNVYPKFDDIHFTKGSMDELGSYEFGNHVVKHRFCQHCGCSLFVDGRNSMGIVAVNIRNLKLDMDADTLEWDLLNYKVNDPQYEFKE